MSAKTPVLESSAPVATASPQVSQLFPIKAVHIAEKLRLKDLRERFSQKPLEFSNYEMVVQYGPDSYMFVYNYGSVVFFNVSDVLQEKELNTIQEYRVPQQQGRANDVFLLEVASVPGSTLGASTDLQSAAGVATAFGLGVPGGVMGGAAVGVAGPVPPNRVYFDRVVVYSLSYEIIKIVCMLLAESTALEYYENLIENLLIKTNSFAKTLRRQGRMLESTQDLIKFIGLCLDTKQEIISNLYIVDSPDETWESVVLDKMHQELKLMMEIDVRYRALEYKIKIIQEGVEVIVDLSKSKRETLLEMTIILLIAFEIILSIIKWH